jgi:hypothetical protein
MSIGEKTMTTNTPESRIEIPAGTPFEGGIYAGLTIHDNALHTLILLPGEFTGDWWEAFIWAEQQGGVLPSRLDALVLLKNLKSEFKPEWYWTSTQHESCPECAWVQDFDNGNQNGYRKGNDYRARAVRRIAI